jgi:hypothetical protein
MMRGVQFEEVWKALYGSYATDELAQMLRTRLNVDLEDIVAPGAKKTVAFELLQAAERQGWEVDLIREAYRFNAENDPKNVGNAALLRVYEKYGLAPAVSMQLSGTEDPQVKSIAAAGFEKTIKDRLPPFDFSVFQEKMAQVEGRVCRVELGGNAAGTGFLVGPDAVLTNYHVLEDVLNGTVAAAKVTCRFDYKVLADGSRVEGTAVGLYVGLHATDWKLDFSPYSAAERTRTPEDPPPTPDELDYALVRLARRFGDEPATPKGGARAPKRGWITLGSTAPPFVPKMALMIAQHPDGKPLKLAVDTESVIAVNPNRTRVRYATSTEHGSSGSPVFDLEWNLVALHHLGDPAYDHPASYNQGVPIDLVQKRIAAQGKAEALGPEIRLA